MIDYIYGILMKLGIFSKISLFLCLTYLVFFFLHCVIEDDNNKKNMKVEYLFSRSIVCVRNVVIFGLVCLLCYLLIPPYDVFVGLFK